MSVSSPPWCILYFLPDGIHLFILCALTQYLDRGISYSLSGISGIWLAQWMMYWMFDGKDPVSSFWSTKALAQPLQYSECSVFVYEITEYLTGKSFKKCYEAPWLYLYYYFEFSRHFVVSGVSIWKILKHTIRSYDKWPPRTLSA